MCRDLVTFGICRLQYVWLGSKGPFIFKQTLSNYNNGRVLPRNRWYVMVCNLTFHLLSEKYVMGQHYWSVIAKSRSSYFWIKRKPVTHYVKAKSRHLYSISLSFLYSEIQRKTMPAVGFWSCWLLDIDCHSGLPRGGCLYLGCWSNL